MTLQTIPGRAIELGSDAEGDLAYHDGSKWTRLAKGAAGQYLATNSGATAPEWVTAPTSDSIPTGVLNPYAGATAPVGWLLCFGQSISRTTYATLFTAIGTTYGSASGTTFNLPDMRGQVTAGLDNMGGTSRNRVLDTDADVLGGEIGDSGGHSHGLITTQQDHYPDTSFPRPIPTSITAEEALQPTIFLNYIIKI